MSDYRELVIADLADENVDLIERAALGERYRAMAQAGIGLIAEQQRAIDSLRQRIASLLLENKSLRAQTTGEPAGNRSLEAGMLVDHLEQAADSGAPCH